MSKRIVINAYGSSGDLNPFLAVAQGLQKRGHNVVIATDDLNRASVESLRLEFHRARSCFVYAHVNDDARPFRAIHNSYYDLLAAVRRA